MGYKRVNVFQRKGTSSEQQRIISKLTEKNKELEKKLNKKKAGNSTSWNEWFKNSK